MCDWEGCTTGTIGLPNPNRRSVVRTSGFLHPYIYRYTARVPRDRFLVLEREGITWMGQPSCQRIALFSVRIEFWRYVIDFKVGQSFGDPQVPVWMHVCWHHHR